MRCTPHIAKIDCFIVAISFAALSTGLNCSHPGAKHGSSTGSGGSSASGGGPGADGGGGSSGDDGGGGQGADGGGGSTPPPMTTYQMIDDLEDGDGRIVNADGHQGPWHAFNSSSGGNQKPGISDPFLPEMGGAHGSMWAVHTSGDGYSYAGVGLDLNNADTKEESSLSMPFDASAWTGLTFWAKGTAKLRIEFSMKSFVPRDRGGTCDSNCWDVYGSLDVSSGLGTDWKQYKVPFMGMQREMGGSSPPFDPTQ